MEQELPLSESNQELLDLSGDNDKNGKDEFKSYDSRPQEDSARRIIAYALVGLLAFVVVWALVSVTFFCCYSEKIQKVLEVVLTPIITLVSAATGFYYGSKSNAQKSP